MNHGGSSLTEICERQTIELPDSTLSQDLATVINCPLYSDFQFIVKGTPIFAHQAYESIVYYSLLLAY